MFYYGDWSFYYFLCKLLKTSVSIFSMPTMSLKNVNLPVSSVDYADVIAFTNDIADAPSERAIINIVLRSETPSVSYRPRGSLSPITYHPATNVFRGKSEGSEGLFLTRKFKSPAHDDTPVFWSLPGHGPRSNLNCGVVKGRTACGDGHSMNPTKWYCNNPRCPDCFNQWTKTASAKAMQKLRGARDLFDLYGYSFQLCHVVVSAPLDSYDLISTVGGSNLMYENFSRVFAWFGMHGVGILHPWRENGESDDLSEDDAVHNGGWRAGLHMHFIGFCNPDVIKSMTDDFYTNTGWVVKVISEDLSDDYSENAISYALSHAGIGTYQHEGKSQTSFHSVRYFGYLSPSKMAKVCEIDEKVTPFCKCCGGPIYDLEKIHRCPEDDAVPETTTLHHVVYCPRDMVAGCRLSILGMTDDEIRRTAINSDFMSFACDNRDVGVVPNFSDMGIGPRSPTWCRPPRDMVGQSSIIGSENADLYLSGGL